MNCLCSYLFNLNPSYGLYQKLFSILFCVVRVLDMDDLNCLIDWIHNFIVKESYTQVPYYFSNYYISYRNHPVSRRNIRAHPGTRRGYFWSSGQRCWTNWSPELRFGRAKVYWLHRHHYRQAPMHNPIILNYAIYYYLLMHLNYWSWMKILDA